MISPKRETLFSEHPLFGAALDGDIEQVAASLESDPTAILLVDEDGRSALHYAALEVHAEVARFLLEKGAEVDSRDKWGWTPLIIAIYEEILVLHERLPVVHELIVKGADVNLSDGTGNTPLHFAALRDELEVAMELVSHGANIHARDRKGQTALEVAVEERASRVAELLRTL